MITISQQQWNECFKKLPEEIRGVLMDPDNQLADRVATIATKHGADDVQADRLTRITSYLLMGFITPTQFISTIMEDTDIPREKAVLLAGDINHDIFNGVKDALKKVHEKPSALPKIDPSLVTCLPGQMSKEAQAGNNAPGNNVAVGSIFEQKLGGAFRMKSEVVSSVGVVPPPPQPTLVTPPPPQPTKPATAGFDPYRELPH